MDVREVFRAAGRGALAAGAIVGPLAGWVALDPSRAEACGGFFCSSAPVDQAGETIVYSLESDGTITMTVEVDYRGFDDDFAWILPVPAPPEISIGSPALFDTLRAATQPMFLIDDFVEGTCRPHPRCIHSSGCGEVSTGCGMTSSPGGMPWTGGYVEVDAAPRMTVPDPDAGSGMPVTIYSDERVGPYDAVVLGATTGAEVVTWLREHGYDIPEQSVELLEPYAASGQVFVALRLSANAATGVLRPITLRMTTAEACLPIRLTAIATVPNMPIAAFFLGAQPVSPMNYSTAVVDTTDLGFFTGDLSYPRAVRAAVDELGGQAFAVDYSGPTPAVVIARPAVDALATELDPAAFLAMLRDLGYTGDSILLELLERHLRPPDGVDATAYYNCLTTGSTSSCGEPLLYDPAALADAIEREIREPRARAQEMVDRHPHLTRLYTEMSAAEMTLDPIFVEERRVPPTSNVHRARRVTECSADYFEEDAPQRLESLGGERRLSSGTRADDRAFCRRFGAVPEADAPVCDVAREDDGCMCSSKAVSTLPAGVGFAALIALLIRRGRRWARTPASVLPGSSGRIAGDGRSAPRKS
jgi:hypothetical protein